MASDTAPSPASSLWPLVVELIERYPSRAGSTAGKAAPEWGLAQRIKESLLEFAKTRAPSEHWIADASVGKGAWTHVPWAAVLDARETHRASRGVYVGIHLISEDRPGIRFGIGAATNEYKGNLERIQERAREVLEQIPQESRERLRHAGLIERDGEGSSGLAPDLQGRTGAWDRGMVSQAFVPLDEIEQRQEQLDAMLEQLLQVYSRWADMYAGGGDADDASELETLGDRRWWAIAAGTNGAQWRTFREDGLITLGWPAVGDLSKHPDKASILKSLGEARGSSAEPKNDALALYEFSKVLREGDLVVAKRGRSHIYGVGIVRSGYRYEPARKAHPHVRDVEWVALGSWSTGEVRFASKALTDITRKPEFRPIVNSILEGESSHGSGIAVDEDSESPPAPYSIDDAASELFLDRPEIEAIIHRLRRKKNLILSGPPGVGKTFAAQRLAWLLLGEKSASRIERVQFHQSYSYEDFVQGIRPGAPSQDGPSFRVRNGPFYEFCGLAESDPDRPHVLLIDEINRGNLSRILGELMMLIEHDKRGPGHAITLTYSEELSDKFSVPENLYIIGMMNTADRSLSMVDYALRRRFAFVPLRPRFESARFEETLRGAGASEALCAKIVQRMTALNAQIVKDKTNLGRGYEIGHSFFCTHGHADEVWYADVVQGEILPLLHEYWWEDPQKAEDLAAELLR